jgi:hypothetical protein
MTSNFSFSQVGGYLAFPPARLQSNPAMMKLFFGYIGSDTIQALRAYCYATHVDAVVVAPGTDPKLITGIQSFGWRTKDSSGVSIYYPQQ